MSIQSLQWSKELREYGSQLGRVGMSKRVIELVSSFNGTYKGAMILAGHIKAIAQAASCDEYWKEKVDIGFHQEMAGLSSLFKVVPNGKT